MEVHEGKCGYKRAGESTLKKITGIGPCGHVAAARKRFDKRRTINSPSKLTWLLSSEGRYHTGSRNNCLGSISPIFSGREV